MTRRKRLFIFVNSYTFNLNTSDVGIIVETIDDEEHLCHCLSQSGFFASTVEAAVIHSYWTTVYG